jgi:hypothetical protein
VLFLHLFDGTNSPAKIGNFYQFLLDCFQPLMPLAMSNVSLRIILTAPSVLVVQRLKLSDFGTEVGDLFAKHFQVVHNHQHSIRISSQVITSVRCTKQL